jgi:PASTA domain
MATFDFFVSSMNVIKSRTGHGQDTDYATLLINALAADNTVITRYPPITRSLGNIGGNSTIDPWMSLTGIAVPEGGSLAVSFVVVNKGSWAGDSTVINALELAGSAVLGALIQGAIVSPGGTAATATAAATTTTAISFSEAVAAAAVIIGALEAINILLVDCDGTVVPGALSLGQTELLEYANTRPWNITVAYPGTDSPPFCGPNSEYSVTYTVINSALVVAVPGVIGLSPTEAAAAFTAAKLTVETTPIVTHSTEDPLPAPRVINQSPPAGTRVPVGSVEQIEVSVPEREPGHPLE